MAWVVRMSSSRNRPYFLNVGNESNNVSQWDPPSGMLEEEINELPGAKEYWIPFNTGTKQSDARHESSQDEINSNPDQVRASHLLIKHSGSRRPSSWKEENITRSKEEAIEILRGHQAEINGSSQKFAELAQIHSDCSSYKNGGDLGWFGRKQMQKPFEDAAYGLQVGEISDVISTDSGVHLVLRTG